MVGIELNKPRTASRSVYRPAAGVTDVVNSVEDYYRCNFFYPAVDNVIEDLKHRFGDKQIEEGNMSVLIPSKMRKPSATESVLSVTGEHWDKLQKVVDFYSPLLMDDGKELIKSEYDLWFRKWENFTDDEKPRTALSTLDKFSNLFPNISILLQLLSTLPITTAEAERVFSKMERTLTAIDQPWKKRV